MDYRQFIDAVRSLQMTQRQAAARFPAPELAC